MRNFIFFLGILVGAHAQASEIQFLSADSLGNKPFDAKAFKSGDTDTRASMTADLVKKNPFAGKEFLDVESELGKPDGHYQTNEPAYVVKQDGKDLIQVVFLPDASGKKVDQIKVHKRFCSLVPPELPAATSSKSGKKLNVKITGEVAKAMFQHMKDIEGEKGSKKGESVVCTAGKTYTCAFNIDEDGVIEAK